MFQNQETCGWGLQCLGIAINGVKLVRIGDEAQHTLFVLERGGQLTSGLSLFRVEKSSAN